VTNRPAAGPRLRSGVERLAFGAAWIGVVALLSLGAASAVTGLSHEPGPDAAGSNARPELTWAADSAAAPVLESALAELDGMAAQLEALGVRGRGALAAMNAREFDVLETAVSEGALLLSDLRDRSLSLRGRLEALPAFRAGAELRLSSDVRERHQALVQALGATDGLGEAWARLASGGLSAARLSTLLERHDAQVGEALEAGSVGSFPTALRRLDGARATLDEADQLRAQLQNTSDVATLVEWIRRNRDYDEAVRALYVASAASPDRVTPEIRAALANETQARARLPESTRPLSIVMTDIAQGGVNQAVISVEQARGEVADALAALEESSG
jgi:hypothetical protein